MRLSLCRCSAAASFYLDGTTLAGREAGDLAAAEPVSTVDGVSQETVDIARRRTISWGSGGRRRSSQLTDEGVGSTEGELNLRRSVVARCRRSHVGPRLDLVDESRNKPDPRASLTAGLQAPESQLADRGDKRRIRPMNHRAILAGRSDPGECEQPCCSCVKSGTGAGVRTLTPLRAADFKSAASASSATPA